MNLQGASAALFSTDISSNIVNRTIIDSDG
jgi:hypothetical protein